MEGSTFWVGISSAVVLEGADFTGFEVDLTTEGGVDCGRVFMAFRGPRDAWAFLLTGSIATRAALRQQDCRSGDLSRAVRQRGENNVDGAGLPVQLDIFEEPPVVCKPTRARTTLGRDLPALDSMIGAGAHRKGAHQPTVPIVLKTSRSSRDQRRARLRGSDRRPGRGGPSSWAGVGVGARRVLRKK